MKRDEVNSSTSLFLYKAGVDYSSAALLWHSMENGEVETDPEIVLFHLQQATEKGLKALISDASVRIRNSHDIAALVAICKENSIVVPEVAQQLYPLTEFAVDGRYSIIHDDVHDCSIYLPLVQELLAQSELLVKNKDQK